MPQTNANRPLILIVIALGLAVVLVLAAATAYYYFSQNRTVSPAGTTVTTTTEPTVTVPESLTTDGVKFGFLTKISGNNLEMVTAEWIDSSNPRYQELCSNEEDCPNGYRIDLANSTLLTVPVASNVKIEVLFDAANECMLTPDLAPLTLSSLAQLADSQCVFVSEDRTLPFYVTIVNGQVTAIKEQYIP